MNLMKLLASTTLLLFVVCCEPTLASLVLTLGNASDAASTVDVDPPLGPFTAGSSVSIPVYGHITGLTPNPLTTYSFPIDLGGDGEGIPPSGAMDYFSNFPIGLGGSGGPTSAIGGNLELSDDTGFSEFDFLAEWNGSVSLSSNPLAPTLLFVLSFDTEPTTPAGVYDVLIPEGAISNSQTSFNAGLTPITDFLFDNGQFRIQAVPEPNSLLSLAFLGFLSQLAFRRKPGRSLTAR